ncbi:GMC family oxidoreductase N-terminal domain-containing protein [Ensifer adhaerens]|uniref:GMC family oxidoreductase n=1 Tax=Ensifer adhaerens TaxID=106592 RepID=UPI001CBD69D3|nr:GMC family oxidoreductase N-terminal domain-containing protein [Ensifer adhaerens]MBZ7924226.1 GMC family oxidoreductase N-terminal domain-containing protein [Ensifer adhaerens]UAX96520.1 GMC family oxidoreductase N-terminal domain-containing protein [Ensifer adhaerens]UAY04136.1 GMC family oxidoreductase N-terminal domain-containing protein [Ensifer adhaerens]UAY12122.1 GMC family oxidoreductase N-terminal domain-containing protein [Ensifer adhaerens]
MLKDHYDYIIVGAGAAGCVLASRLSEDEGAQVLLVEQGASSNSLLVNMPAAVGAAINTGRFSQVFDDEDAGGGSGLSQIQGRTLGGSTAINGMMYVRGNPADYDEWALAGCEGWAYRDVLPYFLKAEGHCSREGQFHSQDGPLGVSSPNRVALSPTQTGFLQAATDAGYMTTDDFNGARQEGFGLYDRTTSKGVRSSAYRAYIVKSEPRENITVAASCKVTRIEIDNERAQGIRVRNGMTERSIRAGEVIICAGAYQSPQLLMLSGIGDKTKLEPLGVRVVVDAPGVGANLQNHPDITVQYRTPSNALFGADRFPRKQLIGLQWLLSGTGVGASNLYEVGGFVRSRVECANPDLQLTLFDLALEPGTMMSRPYPGFQIHITLVKPESRGEVALRSVSPDDPPIIRLNYLSSSQDLAALRSGLNVVRGIAAQRAFNGIETYPGPFIQSNTEIDDWIRTKLASFFHPVGTCRMGRAGDIMTVVDPKLRVYGVSNLRVVDASVMPTIPAGNTYAPTVMVAEKAADIIKEK